jgi:hypothetical protein
MVRGDLLPRRAAVRGELRWDFVSQAVGQADASAVVVTVGYKHYF